MAEDELEYDSFRNPDTWRKDHERGQGPITRPGAAQMSNTYWQDLLRTATAKDDAAFRRALDSVTDADPWKEAEIREIALSSTSVADTRLRLAEYLDREGVKPQ